MHRYALFFRHCCLLAMMLFSNPGQTESDTVLTVQFEGMANEKGMVVCSLVDTAEHFLSKEHEPLHICQSTIKNGKSVWEIRNLPFGRYAISAYHDANNNGELDSGLFGIPIEDYGFSNNARGSFGPPDYEDAVFEFNEANQQMLIWIK